MEERIAQASKVPGALRKAVLLDKNLTLATKNVFNDCLMSVMLYIATDLSAGHSLRKHIYKLNSLLQKCIKGISSRHERDERTIHV